MTQEEMDALMAGGNEVIEETITNNSSGHKEKELDGGDMVQELGSVTADSEVKATEIFDKLDSILEMIDSVEASVKEDNKENTLTKLTDMRNTIFSTMDIMQYQDIHRQKIERVINTMRSIAKVMNQSLNGIDSSDNEDTNFAPSAKHIAGDDDDDQVDDDELAALIASMGKE